MRTDRKDSFSITLLELALFIVCTATIFYLLGSGVQCYAVDISSFGGMPDGSDTTLALDAAIGVAEAGPDKTVTFGAGNYRFLEQPVDVTTGVRLIGQGKSSTVLEIAYNGSFLNVRGQGSSIRDLTIFALPGVQASIAIHMIADNSLAGGNHDITNIWITGEGTWAIPIFLDGANRTIPPIGIRAVVLNNVNVFNATSWAMEWWNAESCEWYGGGAYQGFGTTEAIAVGGALANSNYINAHVDYASSTIWANVMRIQQ